MPPPWARGHSLPPEWTEQPCWSHCWADTPTSPELLLGARRNASFPPPLAAESDLSTHLLPALIYRGLTLLPGPFLICKGENDDHRN